MLGREFESKPKTTSIVRVVQLQTFSTFLVITSQKIRGSWLIGSRFSHVIVNVVGIAGLRLSLGIC